MQTPRNGLWGLGLASEELVILTLTAYRLSRPPISEGDYGDWGVPSKLHPSIRHKGYISWINKQVLHSLTDPFDDFVDDFVRTVADKGFWIVVWDGKAVWEAFAGYCEIVKVHLIASELVKALGE